MLPDTPGYNYARNFYSYIVLSLLQEKIIKSPIVLVIEEQNFNNATYATLPDITQSMIDKLIDYAYSDPEKLELELLSVFGNYRLFSVKISGNNLYAKINFKLLLLCALLKNPHDDVLLLDVYRMGRCNYINGQGKRCKRRAAAGRHCHEHDPQNQPAPPPAAE